MTKLNGNNLIEQIAKITILYTDKELLKHFSPNAPKIFRKCADRVEEVHKRKSNLKKGE